MHMVIAIATAGFLFVHDDVRSVRTNRETDERARLVTWPTGRPHNNEIATVDKYVSGLQYARQQRTAAGWVGFSDIIAGTSVHTRTQRAGV